MPRRPDIRKVLIIGSGPIVIGQACEFDYSGTQACKALRGLGYEIVLVNSNPATIMTDPVMADETYIEPLNLETLDRDHRHVEARRAAAQPGRPVRPQPFLGAAPGGRARQVRREDHRRGPDAIERGEDRLAFKETMNRLGIEMPRSEICYSRRGGRSSRRRARLPGGHPARLHHGRHGRRPGLQRRGAAGDRGARHPRPAWSARSWWRSRCWAGRSWSSRWSATPRTR